MAKLARRYLQYLSMTGEKRGTLPENKDFRLNKMRQSSKSAPETVNGSVGSVGEREVFAALAYRAEALHGSSSVEVVVPEHLPLERGAEQRAEQREASLVVGVEGARRALGARGRRLARQLVGERDGADGLARRGEHLL